MIVGFIKKGNGSHSKSSVCVVFEYSIGPDVDLNCNFSGNQGPNEVKESC